MPDMHLRRGLVAVVAMSASLWAAAAEPDERWRFSAGAGVATLPEYPGSDENRTRVVPLVSARYGRFFAGADPDIAAAPAGFGYDLYRNGGWRLGIAVYSELTRRKESDDERLQGLGDVDRAARAGLLGSYSFGRYVLRASVGSDVSGNDQGTLARLDAFARFQPAERWTLSAGPGITWADSEYTRTFFGVDADQSARSGLPQHEAKSGLNTVRFSVAAIYQIDRNWSAGALFSAARLQGDAADSPVTQDKSQNTAFAFFSYRF